MNQKQGNTHEAASPPGPSFEETNQAVVECLVSAQERTMQTAQSWGETVQQYAQTAQTQMQEMEQQIQQQQKSFHRFAQQAIESSFDLLQASLSAFVGPLRLTENLQICLLAFASRYPRHLVDINEAVLGIQHVQAAGWSVADLIAWLQSTAPAVLHTRARLEIDAQHKNIYLLERSEETPAFWLYCGEASAKSPTPKGSMAARHAAPPPV